MTAPTPEGTPTSRTEMRAQSRARRRTRRTRIVVGVAVLMVLALAGGFFVATQGGGSGTPAAKSVATTRPPSSNASDVTSPLGVAAFRSAVTKGDDIAVYATPDESTKPTATLSKQTNYQLPRSFLVFEQNGDWLHVLLPTRPNNSTGWIKADDVYLGQPLQYQVKITIAEHKLTVLKNGAVVFDAPAAVGTSDDPTPTGTFFYTDPLDLANDPGTAYGVYAIGLSGHSNALSEFAGGDAEIAIHGTNDPSSIGKSVSHGCVRVDNDVILKLAALPLDTPVIIS